ncbi:hypothetical protein BDK89_2198 [Ilumatobacter fluminis]|uniref:Uncharacterized protein n=1 Tax=Ilumatobacter fluminis TaxID=467091 RepID=A0A4R7I1W5_9ACTN|nr:hypothetical protein [Ilumatobacter fluminis]TDT16606.1 hypothetical protein BDK89_2198 [Ilumatobacter fluminis]
MIGASSFAVDIGDPDSTRTVWAIVALLVVMGLGLVMVAFWLRRSTRPDPEFLGPLELMGERTWRRGDPVWQRRRLDEVRPEGAEPLRRAAAPPRLDESFDAGPSVTGFDDLHDDGQDDREHAAERDADGIATSSDPTSPTRHTPSELPVTPLGDGSGDDVGVDAERDGSDEAGDSVADDRAATPLGSARPFLDDLPEHEIDPDEMRRAMEALDAELQPNRDD